MELMEIGRITEIRSCRLKDRIDFEVKKETPKILVGKGNEPMNRLQDLIGIDMTQKLGREAEQLSQRVEQTLILKDLELSRKVEQALIWRDLGTVLRDLGKTLRDLGRIPRMV